MENHHFSSENPLYMVIFNSYVRLPEGTPSYSRFYAGTSGKYNPKIPGMSPPSNSGVFFIVRPEFYKQKIPFVE